MALMAADCLSPSSSCPGPCHCGFLPGLLQKSPNLSPQCHTLSHLFSIQHPEISFRTSHNIPFLCLKFSGYVPANAINQEKNNKIVKKKIRSKNGIIESGHKKPQVAFCCHFFSVSSDVKWALILSCLSHPQQLCGMIFSLCWPDPFIGKIYGMFSFSRNSQKVFQSGCTYHAFPPVVCCTSS